MRIKLVVLGALLVATLGLAGCYDTPGGYGGYGYPSYGYGYPSYGYGYSRAYGYGGWGRYHHWNHDWDQMARAIGIMTARAIGIMTARAIGTMAVGR
jgi:hypothetical protein